MSSKERPLGEVIEVLEKIGAEISYAYDDLVFVNHSAYLIQFGEKHKDINIFYNKECRDADIVVFKKDLEAAFKTKSFNVKKEGRFELIQKQNEELEIKFY